MEVVLPDGSVTWFGGKRRKDVTGYDFVHLMVGSEGTLGIVTKIILRLLPLSSFVVDLLVPFPDIPTALAAVPKVMTLGKAIPSSIEFMDKPSMLLTEKYLQTKFPYTSEAKAHIIFQYEGNNRDHLADEIERIGDICMESGALEVFVADNRTTRDKLWKGRKSVAEAVWAFAPVQLAMMMLLFQLAVFRILWINWSLFAAGIVLIMLLMGIWGTEICMLHFTSKKILPDWHSIIEGALT